MPGISTCANTPLWPRIRCKRGGSTRSIGCHALPSVRIILILEKIEGRKKSQGKAWQRLTVLILEKIEGRKKSQGKAWQRLTVSSLHGLHVYIESEAKEVCWHMWRSLACPLTSRTLFSSLRVSTHSKQVAPYSVRFLLTSQEGGRRAYSTPGPARGWDLEGGTVS